MEPSAVGLLGSMATDVRAFDVRSMYIVETVESVLAKHNLSCNSEQSEVFTIAYAPKQIRGVMHG